jgi:hypothetical protein
MIHGANDSVARAVSDRRRAADHDADVAVAARRIAVAGRRGTAVGGAAQTDRRARRPVTDEAANCGGLIIVAMLNRPAIHADCRTLTIVGKNELPNSRRQIAFVFRVYHAHKARNRLVPRVGNFFQATPELVFKTYAGLVMGDHDRVLQDLRFHDGLLIADCPNAALIRAAQVLIRIKSIKGCSRCKQ